MKIYLEIKVNKSFSLNEINLRFSRLKVQIQDNKQI
jgi:hypothetical protein